MNHRDLMHPETRDEVENARGITAAGLRDAYLRVGACRARFDRLVAGHDAWLTPSVPGEAPPGIESTGEATFNRMWTAIGAPCVTLPGRTGPHAMPVGVQLVGPRFGDESLLAVAAACAPVVAGAKDGRR